MSVRVDCLYHGQFPVVPVASDRQIEAAAQMPVGLTHKRVRHSRLKTPRKKFREDVIGPWHLHIVTRIVGVRQNLARNRVSCECTWGFGRVQTPEAGSDALGHLRQGIKGAAPAQRRAEDGSLSRSGR